MPPTTGTEILLDSLAFPECPRWHDGRLWISDMHAGRVLAFDPDARRADTVVEVAARPGGLGWQPDGRLLVVSMTDRRLLRARDGGTEVVADLSGVATGHCNDMVVDPEGRAYVGNFGFDLDGGAPFRATCLVAVDTDTGSVRAVAGDLAFPNGCVLDGAGTLIVAETFGNRLTAFRVAADGSLTDRRVFADLPGAFPDGICLDAEGAVWYADPLACRCVRVREGGAVLAEVRVEQGAFACMLGGDDRRTLFVCTAGSADPAETVVQRRGRIEAATVDVPGAGLP